MGSPAVKNLSCLLTPKKSPLINLFTSSLNKKLFHTVHVECTATNRNTSQEWYFQNPSSEIITKFSNQSFSVKSSIEGRYLLPNNKTARCLFPPEKSSLSSLQNHKLVSKNLLCHQQAPSFNTPHRNLLSSSGLRKRVKGFVLGRGSFGLVVLGEYKNERVAVKIIQKIKEQKQYISLKSEMNALKLKHPNIIKVHKVIGQPNNNMGFVVMELCDHTNLESLLQSEFMPLKIKLRYLIDTASALEYCHKYDIIHLDVKPKNIIVSSLDKSCKLCDFGSSVNLFDSQKSDTSANGTLKYCAPEILRGKAATKKADTYSFGITMWQIIHQQSPYDTEDLHVVVYKVVNQNYRPGNRLNVTDTDINFIYQACWEANPTQRPSMSQVKTMLKEIN